MSIKHDREQIEKTQEPEDWTKGMDWGQKQEIQNGLEAGVDVSVYAKPEYNWEQMCELRKGLQKGLNVSAYANPEYDDLQMRQLRMGLEAEVDIRNYASLEYDGLQMMEIREGLEAGVDVSVYAKPEYNWEQMCELRKGLQKGLDVAAYADPKFSDMQLRQLQEGLEKGVDISVYDNPEYDWKQMQQLRERLEKGPDEHQRIQITDGTEKEVEIKKEEKEWSASDREEIYRRMSEEEKQAYDLSVDVGDVKGAEQILLDKQKELEQVSAAEIDASMPEPPLSDVQEMPDYFDSPPGTDQLDFDPFLAEREGPPNLMDTIKNRIAGKEKMAEVVRPKPMGLEL